MAGAVCPRCIEERWLAAHIKANATEDECDYCGHKAKRPIAMLLDHLMPHIKERIECIYEDPANSVGYETAEGGYQLSTMDAYEVLEDVGLGVESDELRQDLVNGLGQYEWVHRNPYSVPEEDALRLSWEEFSNLLKHRVRYLLFPPERDGNRDSEGIEPAEMLDSLGDLFVKYELISALRSRRRLYRVRLHKPEKVPENTLATLGPPPIDCARFSNRMSPAGVSMFYGALDEATARAETYVRHDGKPAAATIATFEVVRPIPVLNLMRLPQIPSVFASDEANLDRPGIHFLHGFVDDLTQPVEKDGREHVEYVPSQVVTEYVRYRLGQKAGKPIEGILYPSARVEGGVGCVLFVAHEDINAKFLADPAPFKLLADLTRTIAVDTSK